MDYAAKHDQALRRIKDAGLPVTFYKPAVTSYDAATDSLVITATDEWSGYAVEVPSDASSYSEDLVSLEPTTLLFVPNVLGVVPDKDSQITWAQKTRTVREVMPIQPAGAVIAAKVIVV